MTLIKLQIKNRFTGSLLFEYEKDDNTIKDTLLEAINRDADLGDADLRGADLRGADLRGAYLRDADLRDADLGDADFRGAYLSDADLRGADLRGAYLSGAYLRDADLRGADLRGAYLRDADLRDADLGDADFRGAKEIPYVPLACPSDGAFIGWKKVHGKLVKLEIPEDALRCSCTSRKCRCSKAKVLSITDCDGSHPLDEILNVKKTTLLYKVGEMVYPDSFDDDRWKECSHGIHFFINKQDAINY